MSAKEELLGLLEASRGRWVSGEEIAARLGVSRAAVWKAVDALRRDGCEIAAAPRRGYALAPDSDRLSAAGTRRLLAPGTDLRLEVLPSVTSTNALVRARADEPEGLVIAAEEQTQGVGRRGRSFYSPAGGGLYFSVLLKPQPGALPAPLLTAAAAVAVCRAAARVTGRTPGIKWVNDLWLDGKKVCGILTQGSLSMENSGFEDVVVGIGINVTAPPGGFPPALAGVAGALCAQPRGGLKNALLAAALEEFWALAHSGDGAALAAEYRRRSILPGRRIAVLRGEEALPATALDVDENCHLRVRYDDGREETLLAGEVSVRPDE